MIIVMGREVTDAEIGTVVKKLEDNGLKANISRGIERTVIGAIGDERKLSEEMFNALPGVESAMHIASNIKLYRANRTRKIPSSILAASSWAVTRFRLLPGHARSKLNRKWICRHNMCMKPVAV